MSYTSNGIRVWDPADPASIHGASSAMAASINDAIIGTFATTALRDTAYSGLSSAEKAGLMCYITNRQGHCYWDVTSNKWQWMSVHRVLKNGLGVDHDIDTGAISLITMATVALPPGNRLIQVSMSCLCTNLDDLLECFPLVTVSGTGITGTNAYAETYIPKGNGNRVGLSKIWVFTLNGNCDIDVRAQNGNPTTGNFVRFTASRLDVLDLGPTDD